MFSVEQIAAELLEPVHSDFLARVESGVDIPIALGQAIAKVEPNPLAAAFGTADLVGRLISDDETEAAIRSAEGDRSHPALVFTRAVSGAYFAAHSS